MKKRVLLIDDEARVRASLKMVLEPTYEVIQAADAQEGLELFRKEAPHLVLLDVILPGTDGLSVLQTLRAEDRAAPVIMLTGTKSVKTAVDAMKFGAADYLSKPFDVEELRIIVERALNEVIRRLENFHCHSGLIGNTGPFPSEPEVPRNTCVAEKLVQCGLPFSIALVASRVVRGHLGDRRNTDRGGGFYDSSSGLGDQRMIHPIPRRSHSKARPIVV